MQEYILRAEILHVRTFFCFMIPLVFHGHMRDLCSQGCRNKTMSFPLALKANEECIYSTREDAYTRRETIKTGIKHKEMLHGTILIQQCCTKDQNHVRDVSLFSGGGGGGGYQFFQQGSQKILTLPLDTNKKIVTLPRP